MLPDRGTFCCCADAAGTAMLAPHRRVLFVGDSLLQHLIFSLGGGKIVYAGCAPTACGHRMQMLSVYTAGGGSEQTRWPSFWTAEAAWSTLDLMHMDGMPAPTLAVVNHAALHLLHMHPVRSWWDADKQANTRPHGCEPHVDCADWRGAASLSQWLDHDLHHYRTRLGKNATLVLATPHSVCTARFHGAYREWLRALRRDEAVGLAPCVDWAASRPGSNRTFAVSMCRRNVFDEMGSALLAEEFRSVAATHPARVALLDMHAMTVDRCNMTLDGRHYYEVARTEEVSALALIARGGSHVAPPQHQQHHAWQHRPHHVLSVRLSSSVTGSGTVLDSPHE